MSTRLGGVSPAPLGMNLSFNVGDNEANVKQNRELFFGSLDIKLDELAMLRFTIINENVGMWACPLRAFGSKSRRPSQLAP